MITKNEFNLGVFFMEGTSLSDKITNNQVIP